ncbi:MAG TPA: hypothetical protein VFW65_01260 [Pseudonocardiaceae bacterium]|nr:hypothetical protein [Pseudonocardiaceae bacterium]
MSRQLDVYANAIIDSEVDMRLSTPRRPDDDTVSILFGAEGIILEFSDVESLERLSTLATEGAQHLRAVTETTA